MDNLQLIAGSISSFIFITATFPMIYKAWKTRDMKSYSLAQIVLNNVGNLIHWLYIASLPVGPIWLLHTFYTASTVFMLVWCLLYRNPAPQQHPTQEVWAAPEVTRMLRSTQEMASV